ncbi:MAG: glycosyltransferase [Peptococcaceae bacterium]|nr:glycosyltransferase [Peptococcaceae bacterium]
MLCVVLPAYNEEAALRKLLPRLVEVVKDYPYKIFVIDDGSTDQTAAVAELFAGNCVTVLGHKCNRGLGEALRTGLLAAIGQTQYDDVIVTLDSDDTHPPEIIPAMLEKIQSGLDLVVASRFTSGGQEVGLHMHRKVLSHGAGWIMGTFFPLPGIRDYSSGFRAYRAGFLAKGFAYYGAQMFESSGFAVMVELLLKLSMFKPRCGEVPLVLRYDRKLGKSKMPVARTIVGYLSLIVKLRKVTPPAEVEA